MISSKPYPARGVAVGTVVAVSMAAFGVLLWHQTQRAQATPAPAPAASVPDGSFRATAAQWDSLTVEAVKAAAFDSVVTTDGSVAVDDNLSASVFSQYSGRVTAIHAQAGQVVRKGAPLLTLLATETAQASSDLAAAVAAEATARKQLDLARQTEKRQHELLLAEAGAEKDWLQSQADLETATNALRAAEVALSATREKAAVLNAAPPGRAASVGTVATSVIVAPVDGVIVQRQVTPGQYVNSLANGGGNPLFTITDLRTVWVLGNVSEGYAARIRIGQPVEIGALALGDRTLRASVSWISASVDPATHRVPIRAEVANPDQILKPQMTVTFRVLEMHAQTALAIPRSALVYDGAQAHCYVVTGERTLTPRLLELGRFQGELAEVKSGLKAEDRVVTRGSLFIDAAAQGNNS